MNQLQLNRKIPIIASTEVLIAGGGLGGVAAALASARAGARTMLVEANGFLGGVATAGLCCSVFNCLCTEDRHLVIKGIPLEIVDALALEGGGPGMSWRKHKGHIIYDVEKAKLVLFTLLKNAGVEIRLNAMIADVIVEEKHVQSVICCGKNGLEAIECGMLVDATGDCDASALAGAPFVYPKPGAKSSYIFRVGNVDADAFVHYFREHPEEYPEQMDIDWTLREALAQYDENGTFLFPHGGGMQLSLVKKARENGDLPETIGTYDAIDAMQMHFIREEGVCHVITGFTRTESLDSFALTQAIDEGRQIAFCFLAFLKKYMPGFEHAFICATADDLGIRGTRNIVGESSFTRDMKETPYRCKDAAGVGVVEKHIRLHAGKNAWSAQVFSNDVYEFPLSCLIPKGWDNLIIGAGRGADTVPHMLLRVMVTTMAVGQGAGTAAAIAAREGKRILDVEYALIHKELRRQGVLFPEDKP